MGLSQLIVSLVDDNNYVVVVESIFCVDKRQMRESAAASRATPKNIFSTMMYLFDNYNNEFLVYLSKYNTPILSLYSWLNTNPRGNAGRGLKCLLALTRGSLELSPGLGFLNEHSSAFACCFMFKLQFIMASG